jgi:hypothetical protein
MTPYPYLLVVALLSTGCTVLPLQEPRVDSESLRSSADTSETPEPPSDMPPIEPWIPLQK